MGAALAVGTLGLSACGSRSEALPQTISAAEGKVSRRRNPRNGDEVSMLGVGCMRFPTVGGDRYTGDIDKAPTRQMLEYAYECGVNYFDTAWMYHKGTSEQMIGEVLKQYPRESFYLADKMPPTGL